MAKKLGPSAIPLNVQKACDLVKAGVPESYACGVAGIPRRRWCSWKRRAREELSAAEENGYKDFEPSEYVKFLEQLEEALSEWVADQSVTITKASKTDWKAAAWALEKRVEAYQRAQKVMHGGAVGNVTADGNKTFQAKDAGYLRAAILGIGSPDDEEI